MHRPSTLLACWLTAPARDLATFYEIDVCPCRATSSSFFLSPFLPWPLICQDLPSSGTSHYSVYHHHYTKTAPRLRISFPLYLSLPASFLRHSIIGALLVLFCSASPSPAILLVSTDSTLVLFLSTTPTDIQRDMSMLTRSATA